MKDIDEMLEKLDNFVNTLEKGKTYLPNTVALSYKESIVSLISKLTGMGARDRIPEDYLKYIS